MLPLVMLYLLFTLASDRALSQKGDKCIFELLLLGHVHAAAGVGGMVS
jgi:hypothetical protein